MISMQLTRERKYILVAGAVLLLFGVMYRFYPALTDFFLVDSEIAVKERQVQKYRQIVEKRAGLLEQKNILSSRLKRLEAGLLSGRTESLAAVEVQGLIKDAARVANLEIDSMRVLSPRQQGEDTIYLLIPVRFDIHSSIRQLKEMLFQIEASSKLLIVRELRVDSMSRRRPGEIRLTMTVEGVMPRK